MNRITFYLFEMSILAYTYILSIVDLHSSLGTCTFSAAEHTCQFHGFYDGSGACMTS